MYQPCLWSAYDAQGYYLAWRMCLLPTMSALHLPKRARVHCVICQTYVPPVIGNDHEVLILKIFGWCCRWKLSCVFSRGPTFKALTTKLGLPQSLVFMKFFMNTLVFYNQYFSICSNGLFLRSPLLRVLFHNKDILVVLAWALPVMKMCRWRHR